MSYILVVLEIPMNEVQERTRLRSIVENFQTTVRSSKGGEVIAENCFVLDLNHGASALANLLHTAEAADVKYKTLSLQDRPMFASK